MSLDELEQALFAAKWGDAEEDGIEVVARVLQLPVAAVERVLFAARVAKECQRGKFSQLTEHMGDGPSLDYDLKRAISDAVETGLKRARVRYALQNDGKLYVKPSKLVGDRVRDICDGCPLSIECATFSVSTPETCVSRGVLERIEYNDGRLANLRRSCCVTPTKIVGNKVTVTCDHPRGTWTLDVEDIVL